MPLVRRNSLEGDPFHSVTLLSQLKAIILIKNLNY